VYSQVIRVRCECTGEMEQLLQDQSEQDQELVGLVHHVGSAMPASFHLELDKLREVNTFRCENQNAVESTCYSLLKYKMFFVHARIHR
jgi:hypothetical protein